MNKKFILIINAGSSSLKFKLYDEKFQAIIFGIVEKIGQKSAFIDYQIKSKKNKEFARVKNYNDAVKIILRVLQESKIELNNISKIGHRVVHGAEEFIKPTLIDKKLVQKLKKYNKLAPLHNPNNLAGIKACQKHFSQAKNYAVFDTAFHATMPDFASHYALPDQIYKKFGIKKYGFHGISHQYVSLQAARKLKKQNPNLITCHLGSGCSITAIKNGKSVDTSMGFTPLEGLMMMTRSGDLDPAIIFYLVQQGMPSGKVEKLLNKESGLLGVSGLKDMRDIMIASGYKIPGYKLTKKLTAQDKKQAQLALAMFVYRIKKYIGAYWAVLGKVDAIVFTAGIGERNKDVRDLITKDLPNKPRVLVIPTNEELMIARLI